MKRIFKYLVLLILLAVAAIAGYFFLDDIMGTEGNQEILSFVPENFVYAIESDRPIRDWQDLSRSKVWQYLKRNDYFADITTSADQLDSLLNNNQLMVQLIRLGDMVISAHMISPQDYEFVFLVDLKGASKVRKAQVLLISLFKSMNYEVSSDKLLGVDILNLADPETNDVLSLAIVDNILIGSYDRKLLQKALLQSSSPGISANPDFTLVRDKTGRSGIYNLYLNYSVVDQFIKAYSAEIPEMLEGLEEILTFSSFDLNIEDDQVVMNGYTKQADSVASFLGIFKDVGQGRMLADEILPPNTAMFTSLGFGEFTDFYDRLTSYYGEVSPEELEDLEKRKGQTEKLLKIDFKADFFSWMEDEVVTAIVPADESGTKYWYYAMLHYDDYELAREKLNGVSEQIRKRSPVKFKTVDYMGYDIQYLELKGFFKLFFRKMFNRIEQPHYAFIGDYVVFSNDTTSLQYLIDGVISDKVLRTDEPFQEFWDRFDSKSNLFTYINNEHFYRYIYTTLDAEARRGLVKNKDYLLSFPRMGFQLSPTRDVYKTSFYSEFEAKE